VKTPEVSQLPSGVHIRSVWR